jgi:hypothetical protein
VYIADVGQNRWEEVDVEDARTPGLDYGWRHREAGTRSRRARPDSGRAAGRAGARIAHDDGCSIYRRLRVPRPRGARAAGHYVYADYCSGWIRSFRMSGDAVTDPRTGTSRTSRDHSFGQDAHASVRAQRSRWRLPDRARGPLNGQPTTLRAGTPGRTSSAGSGASTRSTMIVVSSRASPPP